MKFGHIPLTDVPHKRTGRRPRMLPYDVRTCLHKIGFKPTRKCFHNPSTSLLLISEPKSSTRIALRAQIRRQWLPNSALPGMNHRLAGMAAESVSKLRHVAEHVVYTVAVQ